MRRLLLIAALGLLLGASPGQGRAAPGGVRSGSWTQTTRAQFSQGNVAGAVIESQQDGEVALAAGHTQGSFVSPVVRADFPFNGIAASWEASVPPEAELRVFLRVRPRASSWSNWFEAEELDAYQGRPRGERTVSDIFFMSGESFQYRAEFSSPSASAIPRLTSLTVNYFDSTAGPTAQELAALAQPATAEVAAAAAAAPSVIPRSSWCQGLNLPDGYGSDCNRYTLDHWPPEYWATQKLIVHHTARSDGSSDPAAEVRLIYYWHAISQPNPWGDIGYNFLIDTYGNIYEGRYGGDNVVGAHAAGFNYGSNGIAVLGTYMSSTIPAASRQSLVNLLAWESAVHGIDPLGRGWFVNRDYDNIAGHRDVNATLCPGSAFYNDLPSIRQDVANALASPDYGVAWVSHNVPSSLAAGITRQVTIVVRNTGTATWQASGADAVRLGYRWYDPGGSQYTSEPLMEQYTALPNTVGPGQEVTLRPTLKVPWTQGNFTVRWELRRGSTWFSQLNGNPQPLVLPVTLAYSNYVEEWGGHNTPGIMTPGQVATVQVQVTNRGLDTWVSQDGGYSYHLGYHWYDASGAIVDRQVNYWEDYRSNLPYAVGPGQSAIVTALLGAPEQPGTYILKWDMVHEGITWFAEAGNTPLSAQVTVIDASYRRFLPLATR